MKYSKEEREALKNLRNNEIVIKASDKGRGIVIQDKTKYEEECYKLLRDGITYKKINRDPSDEIKKKLYLFLEEFSKKGVINRQEELFLKIDNPVIPVFYTLPKIHKSVAPPGRPIVAGVNSLTSNLSQFLDSHLQKFMSKIKSYLKDTGQMLRILNKIKWQEGCYLGTADVSALYSSIHHKDGIEAISWMLDQSELDGDTKEFVLKGIDLILKKQFFLVQRGILLTVGWHGDGD